MMRYLIFVGVTLVFWMMACTSESGKTHEAESRTPLTFKAISVQYPNTIRDTTIVDDYHGKEVADPYRWLEDPNSENTREWVKAQNAVTFDYLKQIPYRENIENRLKELWNYERYSPPFKEGGKYYFFKNDGLQNQSVLYVQESLDAEAEVVLDPNQFSEDGTVALGGYSFSKDGRYLAYQFSEGGSDWRKARILDLKSGKELGEELNWIKFSGLSWAGNGFFYSRYPKPEEGEELSGSNTFQKVYYHELGTSQEEDALIFADRAHPKRGFVASTTEDEQYLALSVWETTSGNGFYIKELGGSKADDKFKPVVETLEHDFSLVGNFGARLLVLTNHEAPNQRLIAITANQPEQEWWEEILPESDDVLEAVYLIGGKIVAQYLHNAANQLKVYDTEGKFLGEVKLPGIGTIGSLNGKQDDPKAFFSFTSFTRPTSIYELDVNTLQTNLFKAPDIAFDSDKYVTRQVWYENPKDGTEIPMFITHKKGLKMDGKRPTLLYGYGGFNISVQPSFSLTRTIVLENDGIYAVPNIRGGGEFGQEWHLAGTLARKQNVFDDFIAAAQFLIDSHYTEPRKLAIQGGSNGGLLVGACMTQRPDLFGVCIPMVGVLDMLRYHQFTIGAAWASDYGLSSDPEAFDYLMAYSPLHNAEAVAYPATLIMTGDHDDRVVPAHSYKFASELQYQHTGDEPVLIRIETSAGHGAGKPVSKQIEESADWLSFLFYNMEEDVRY